MNAQWCLLRVARGVSFCICLLLPFDCFPAEEEEYRPDMEIVAGKLNPTPEVISQASRFPPKAALGFFLNIMSNGTPQARELARTTLIAYPGWEDRFDRKLSEAVEFWKAHQEKQLIRDWEGKNVEVLADGEGADDARGIATGLFYTLAAIKHPSVIPIVAKHLDADGDTYSAGDYDVVPLNRIAARALTMLVLAGVNIPGAPSVDPNKRLVVDEWKEWWRTHRQFYETAAAPAPTPEPPAELAEPTGTPAPQQAKLDEPVPVPTAIKPAPAESGWSAATLGAVAGLALVAALVVLVVSMRGRAK